MPVDLVYFLSSLVVLASIACVFHWLYTWHRISSKSSSEHGIGFAPGIQRASVVKTTKQRNLTVEICLPVSHVIVSENPVMIPEWGALQPEQMSAIWNTNEPISCPDHGVPWSTIVPFGSFQDPRDGRWYRTVRIGRQEWFAENLAYTAQGSVAYGNDPSNDSKYGRLYGWEAAKSQCPPSWHLPTDDEWMELELFSGMNKAKAKEVGWRSTSDEGNKLKSLTEWFEGGSGADGFGFRVLPSGFRAGDGSCDSLGAYANFWSATSEREGSVLVRYFRSLDGAIGRYGFSPNWGLSVRCVREANP